MLAFLLVTVLIFGLGFSLIPTHLTAANYGADAGDLLAAILTNGIPHPTGYPTYMLLGRLAQHLPGASPYARGVWLSLIPAALAAGLAATWPRFWRKMHGVRLYISGLVVGLAWSTSPLLFSQAVVVEVHGLHALFVVLGMVWIAMLLKFAAPKPSPFLLLGLALAYGFGLGNHLTLLLLAPACILALWVARREGMSARLVLGQVCATSLGLFVYLYLPLQARHYPPVNWGNPQTLQGFLWMVSARPYHDLFLSAPPATLLNRLAAWFDTMRQNFGVTGLLLAAVGLVLQRVSSPRQYRLILWVFTSYSLFAVVYYTADSLLYLIPTCLALSLCIGFTVYYFWEWRWRNIALGKIFSAIVLLFLLARLPGTYRKVNPGGQNQPDIFARKYLQAAPPNALLLASSDADAFPLWYYHFGLGWRSDISVIVQPLAQFAWYRQTLMHTYPHLNYPPQLRAEADSASWVNVLSTLNPSHPVCRSRLEAAGIAYTCHDPNTP